MRSEPSHLGGISLILPGSHRGEMKIFHMNTRKWDSSAKWNRFLISFAFFQMLIK